MVAGISSICGTKRVLALQEEDERKGSIHVISEEHKSKRYKLISGSLKDADAMVQREKKAMDEPRHAIQQEERVGGNDIEHRIHESMTATTSFKHHAPPSQFVTPDNKSTEESHELAMAVALASLASVAPPVVSLPSCPLEPIPPVQHTPSVQQIPPMQQNQPEEDTQSKNPSSGDELDDEADEESIASTAPPTQSITRDSAVGIESQSVVKAVLVSSSSTSSCATDTSASSMALSTIESQTEVTKPPNTALDPAPVTPESRNVAQSMGNDKPSDTPGQPEDDHDQLKFDEDDNNYAEIDFGISSRTTDKNRRVHFAPGVKLAGGRGRLLRSFQYPNANLIPTLTSHHPHYHYQHPPYRRGPHPSCGGMRMMAAFHPGPRWVTASSTNAGYHPQEGPSKFSPAINWQPPLSPTRRMAAGPTSLSTGGATATSSQGSNGNGWICDFCHSASFETYEAACQHEITCPWRSNSSPTAPVFTSPNSDQNERPIICQDVKDMSHRTNIVAVSKTFSSDSGETTRDDDTKTNEVQTRPDHVRSEETNTSNDKSICFPLSVPERDSKWLPELQCLLRQSCVEVSSELNKGSNVRLRCQFCKENVTPGSGRVAHLAAFHDAVMHGWLKHHLPGCKATPEHVQSKLDEFLSQDKETPLAATVGDPQKRHYWMAAAQALGMVNTSTGVQFLRKCQPSTVPAPDLDVLDFILKKGTGIAVVGDNRSMFVSPNSVHPHHLPPHPQQTPTILHGAHQIHQQSYPMVQEGQYLVNSGDAELIPPYVYFLLRQVEKCFFSEADRFVARSKGPLGFAGFQCRHCRGHAGLGKYFPVSAKSLSTNSTSQNVHAHLLKCRLCPLNVKQELLLLKEEKSKAPRLEPGWRKVFFDKIWDRLHCRQPPQLLDVAHK